MTRNYCVHSSTCNTSRSFKKQNPTVLEQNDKKKYNIGANILKFKGPTKKKNRAHKYTRRATNSLNKA